MLTATEILKSVFEGERLTSRLQEEPIKDNDLGIFIEGLIEVRASTAVAPAASNMMLQREIGALTLHNGIGFTIRRGMVEHADLLPFEWFMGYAYPAIYTKGMRCGVANVKMWEETFRMKAPSHVVTISDQVFHQHGFEIFYFLVEKQLLKLAALRAHELMPNRDCAFGVAATIRHNLIKKVMSYLATQRTYNVHGYKYRTKNASGRNVVITPKYFPTDTEIALARLYNDHKDYHQEPFEFFRNTDATALLNS